MGAAMTIGMVGADDPAAGSMLVMSLARSLTIGTVAILMTALVLVSSLVLLWFPRPAVPKLGLTGNLRRDVPQRCPDLHTTECSDRFSAFPAACRQRAAFSTLIVETRKVFGA